MRKPCRYHWPGVGDGVCPNGSLIPSATQYPDSDLSVSLSAQPTGKAYSFLGDDLFWLWNLLLARERKPGDVSAFLPFANTSQTPLGDQQTIVFSINYRNRGTVTATNVLADVSSLYALHLLLGTHLPAEFRDHQAVNVGNIGPGDEGSVTFAGVVDRTTAEQYFAACAASQPDYACVDYLWLASVRVLIYDDAHSLAGPPLDWLWVDHKVDLSAPEFFGVQQPEYLLAAGVKQVRGYAFDDAGVPTLTLKIQGSATLVCPDGTPNDGQWMCALDTTGRGDGDVINVQLQATNSSGQASALSAAQPFVVDTLPPTLTVALVAGQAVADGAPVVAQSNSYRIAGQVSDNRGLGRVEVCVDDGPCTPANLQLTGGDTAHIYDDVPDAPLAINSTTTCGGSLILRTFNVSDNFVIGDVSVGVNIQHPQRNDVQAELESPLGTRVRLLYNDGIPGARFANYDVLLNDAATSAYNVGHDDDPAAPRGAVDRPARPYKSLRAFNGQNTSGQWKLTVCDTNPSADDGLYNRSRLALKPRDTTARTGNWSYTVFNADRLDYVPQAVSVYGIDLVGNRATAPLVIHVTVDNAPPVITVTRVMSTTPLTPTVTALTGIASDGGQVSSLFVLVQTPETAYTELANWDGNTWQYDLHPVSPGRYRLWVIGVDLAGNLTTIGPFAVQVNAVGAYQVLMPLVARGYVSAPDLVVNRLIVTSNTAQVVIQNIGTAPVKGEFWVDVYVAPRTAPTGVNQTWEQLGAQGLTWGVTADALPALAPGGVLTLAIGDADYWPDISRVAWPLPVNTPVYAQVDSANADTTFGAVLEIHEITGEPYNNILGPVYSLSAASAVSSNIVQPKSVESSRLPRRP